MTHRDAKTPAAPAVPPAPAAAQPAGSNTRSNSERWDEEDGEEWRHPPVAPKDASPLDSLGRAVSDAVIGSDGSVAQVRAEAERATRIDEIEKVGKP